MKAIIDKDNKIKSCFDGDGTFVGILETDKVIVVPDDLNASHGQDIRCWDKNFMLRDAEKNIKDGFIILGDDEKIINHRIVKKDIFDFDDSQIPVEKLNEQKAESLKGVSDAFTDSWTNPSDGALMTTSGSATLFPEQIMTRACLAPQS